MHVMHLDYETRSNQNIQETGSRAYFAKAKNPEIILAAFTIDDSPVYQWDYSDPDPYIREYLVHHLNSPDTEKYAFNAPFEMQATHYCWGLDVRPREWVCVMAWAYARGFTGRLIDVGKAIGLPEDQLKQADGTRLINLFCTVDWDDKVEDPKAKRNVEKWEKFKLYNCQDVVAETAIANYLAPFPLTEEERALWVWDREVNDRGLPVDVPMIRKAIELAEWEVEELLHKIHLITGLENPNSRDQLLAWLQAHEYPFNDLQQGSLQKAQALDPFAPYQEVIHLRLSVARASTKKYTKMLASQIDGRIYDTLQIWGAGRTGRWSGRGLQLQNLMRPTIKNPEQIADWLHDGEMDFVRAVFG